MSGAKINVQSGVLTLKRFSLKVTMVNVATVTSVTYLTLSELLLQARRERSQIALQYKSQLIVNPALCPCSWTDIPHNATPWYDKEATH
jgi:hypothetical protein